MSSECISLCAWFNERRLSSSWSNIFGLSFCDEINIPVSGPVRSSMCSKVTILNKIFVNFIFISNYNLIYYDCFNKVKLKLVIYS